MSYRRSVYIIFLLLLSLTAQARTIRLRSYTSGTVLTQEMFSGEGFSYKIIGDFELDGQALTIPRNSTLTFKKGSVNHGELHLSDGVTIKANGSEWKQVRLIAEHAANISVSNLLINGEGTSTMHNIFRFMYCENIDLKNIHTFEYYRKYRGADIEVEDDSGFLWYPFLCKDCENISIDGYLSERTYPEGPFFINCTGLDIRDMEVTDNDNQKGRDIWTPINAFYCRDVKISNSKFVRRQAATKSGSTANLCCANMTLTDCWFEGGAGVDFSNEWFNQEFSSRDIVMDRCTIVKATHGIYTQPTPGLVENVTIKNSRLQSSATDDVYGFNFATGNIRNLNCSNCHFSGLIFLQFNADTRFSGEIGPCEFNECTFDDDFYGGYTGRQGPILARNSSAGVDVGQITFNDCTFNHKKYATHLAANAGEALKLTVENSTFDIKSLDIAGGYNTYTLNFTGNKVKSEAYSLNWVQTKLGDALIENNEFENQAFKMHYTESHAVFRNNTFKNDEGESPIIITGSRNVQLIDNKSL